MSYMVAPANITPRKPEDPPPLIPNMDKLRWRTQVKNWIKYVRALAKGGCTEWKAKSSAVLYILYQSLEDSFRNTLDAAIATDRLNLQVEDEAQQDAMLKILLNEIAADTPTDGIKRLLRYMQNIHACKRKEDEEPEAFAKRFQGVASQYLASCHNNNQQNNELFAMVLLENAALPDHTLDNIVLQLIATAKERNNVYDDTIRRIPSSQLTDKSKELSSLIQKYKERPSERQDESIMTGLEKVNEWFDRAITPSEIPASEENDGFRILLSDAVAAVSKVRGRATNAEPAQQPTQGTLLSLGRPPIKHYKHGERCDRGRRNFNFKKENTNVQYVTNDKNKNKRSKAYTLPGTGKKAKSRCSVCGLIGHWYTDDICPGKRKEGKNGDGTTDSFQFFQ